MHNSIYLDYNATTPLDPRVFEAMKPYFEVCFGNPASQLHDKGLEAKMAVENARSLVAKLLKADIEEITFTAGATESNNWALKGIVDFLIEKNPHLKPHILTSNIEHASVREPLLYLQKKGLIEVDFLPVDAQGFLTLETLEKFRKPHTQVLSLIWVHNEIGTIQNIQDISQWALKHGIYLHTDATQAVGKIDVNLQEMPISLLSFSAHKLYGPKGVGVLYIRQKASDLKLGPLLHGGGQESTGRSGTLNVPAIVGMGKACSLAEQEMRADWEKVKLLTAQFWKRLKLDFPFLKLNGPEIGLRTAYNLNITVNGVQGSQLLPQIQNLCVSGGSACRSGNLLGNPILLAIGHNPDDPSVSLRISAGRMSTQEDFSEAFSTIYKSLKSLGFGQLEEGSQVSAPMLE